MKESDIFVWHDGENYKKMFRRGLPALVFSGGLGIALYFALLRRYTEGYYVSWGIAGVVFVILLVVFRRRLFDQMACYVRYEGLLFRLTDANRGITRLAGREDIDEMAFRLDFKRARKSDACWRILSLDMLEETKNGYRVFCKICTSKSGKIKHKNFYLENGYNQIPLLLEELRLAKEEND